MKHEKKIECLFGKQPKRAFISYSRHWPNVSRLCIIFEWVCTTCFYFIFFIKYIYIFFFHPYRRNNVRFFMPFKLLQSLKSINKINDHPPLCSRRAAYSSPPIAVQRKWPIFRESFVRARPLPFIFCFNLLV